MVFEGFLALYHLQGHVGFGYFVKGSQNLPKRAFANAPSHHVSIYDFFARFDNIVMIAISPSGLALVDSPARFVCIIELEDMHQGRG